MSIDQPKQDQDEAVDPKDTAAASEPSTEEAPSPEQPQGPETSKKAQAAASAKSGKANTKARTSTAKPKGRAFGMLVSVLLLLLALGALALAGHNYQQLQAQQELSTRLQTLEQGLALQGQARGELQGVFEGRILEERALWQQSEQQLQRALAQTSARITQMDGNRREDWLLAEVEYLLRLASQRLLVEGDVKSAKVLLESADKVVQSIDDYSLLKVREALQQDLVALRAVPTQDLNGAYLQLAALADQIDQLPSMPVEPFKADQPDVAVTEPAAESVSGDVAEDAAAAATAEDNEGLVLLDQAQGLALEAWHGFTGLYRFNANRDEPVQVLLTPNEEIYLRQNLRLMLEQAQLALLQGRQPVYDLSMAKAQQWLERYFQRQPATQAMAEQLQGLAAIEVRPELPEIGRGLKALKAHLEALYQESLQPRAKQSAAEDKPA